MALRRSRPKTEAKFLNATLELIAGDGCSALGVNAIAHQAGADKVLIYRYFGNLEGLLSRVAVERVWLPSADELLASITFAQTSNASSVLHQLTRTLIHHIESDQATHQIIRWRNAVRNPLTEKFTTEWHELWATLSSQLSNGLDYDQRTQWDAVTTITACIVESELCDHSIASTCIDHITRELPIGQPDDQAFEPVNNDQLPTNLL